MANRTDILLDENFDIIDNGFEWEEGDSDQQHVELLLLTQKGENREFAFAGFGIDKRLRQRTNPQQFLRHMQIEIENDGYNNATIKTGETVADFSIEI